MGTKTQKRAAKASLRDFRMVNYVPKIAQERKSSIDNLLMGYKKENPDFWYLVRNDQRDLKVMIKQLSEGNFVPYRRMSLEVLGRLTPLKTTIPEEKSDSEEHHEETDGFRKQGRTRKQNYTPKDVIYRNITAILNGFEVKKSHDGQ